jgi:hypothetical protein
VNCGYGGLSTSLSTSVEKRRFRTLTSEAETLGKGCSAPPPAFPRVFHRRRLWKRDDDAPARPGMLWMIPGSRRGRSARRIEFMPSEQVFSRSRPPPGVPLRRGRFYQRAGGATIASGGLSTGTARTNPAFSTVSTDWWAIQPEPSESAQGPSQRCNRLRKPPVGPPGGRAGRWVTAIGPDGRTLRAEERRGVPTNAAVR